MKTFTITEAVEITGLSKKALEQRVARGGIRSALVRGRRLIPQSELERLGLIPGREVLDLQQKIAALEIELKNHRQLAENTEADRKAMEDQYHEAQAGKELWESRAHQAAEKCRELATASQQTQTNLNAIVTAGFWEARKLKKHLRQQKVI